MNKRLSERGLIISSIPDKCFICGKKTYLVDICYECPVHFKCQEILDEGYFIALKNGTNSKEYKNYLNKYNL